MPEVTTLTQEKQTQNPPLRQKLQDAYYSAGAAYSTMGIGRKTLLGATAVGLTFEWGTGNEFLLGNVASHTHEATGGDVVMTSSATAATSLAEQSVLGAAVAANIKLNPYPLQSFRKIFYPEATTHKVLSEKRSFSSRFLTAFALGSSAVVASENVQTPRTNKENAKSVLQNSSLIAAGVGLVAVTGSAIANFGHQHGLEQEADLAVNTLQDPKFYAGLLGLKLTTDWIKRMRRQRE